MEVLDANDLVQQLLADAGILGFAKKLEETSAHWDGIGGRLFPIARARWGRRRSTTLWGIRVLAVTGSGARVLSTIVVEVPVGTRQWLYRFAVAGVSADNCLHLRPRQWAVG